VRKYLAIVLAVMFVMVAVGVVSAAEEKKAQDTYTLKAPNGAVKFDHKTHAADFKCEQCHHASKPEKANKTAHEACTDCHTTPPQAGMKTKLQAAFHNPTGQSGTCIDCHKKEVAAGKTAPTKCTECHVKANG
jgi:Class III cytochrome C family